MDVAVNVDDVRLLTRGNPGAQAREVGSDALKGRQEHQAQCAPPQILRVRTAEVLQVKQAVGQFVAHVGPKLLDEQPAQVEDEVTPEDALGLVHVQQRAEYAFLFDIADVNLAGDDTRLLEYGTNGVLDLGSQQGHRHEEVPVHAGVHAARKDLLAAGRNKGVVGDKSAPVVQADDVFRQDLPAGRVQQCQDCDLTVARRLLVQLGVLRRADFAHISGEGGGGV